MAFLGKPLVRRLLTGREQHECLVRHALEALGEHPHLARKPAQVGLQCPCPTAEVCRMQRRAAACPSMLSCIQSKVLPRASTWLCAADMMSAHLQITDNPHM